MRAHGMVQAELDLVLELGLRDRLQPNVPEIGRMPPELERDKVILLVVGEPPWQVPLFHLSLFEGTDVRQRRADRPDPARDTDRGGDVGLRDLGIDCPRWGHEVWERGESKQGQNDR